MRTGGSHNGSGGGGAFTKTAAFHSLPMQPQNAALNRSAAGIGICTDPDPLMQVSRL